MLSSRKMRNAEAARYCHKSPSWMNKSRQNGTGPAFMRLGSTIIYDTADLDAWMISRRVESSANDNSRAATVAA